MLPCHCTHFYYKAIKGECQVNKTPFKKSYGDSLKNNYSKEYMKAYISWRKTLSKKQLALIENCNDYIKGKTKKERARNKRQTKNYYSTCKNPLP